MEELHTDSIDGGHEGQLWARSRARERAYSNIKKGSIVLQYVNTKAQLADMLTKSLAKVEHASFMRLLGLRSRQERLETSS
jgi:hypothetical protein